MRFPFNSVCVEGTGYLPYLRERRLYDLRKDDRGEVDLAKRWAVFEKMRSATLGWGGPAPVADWQPLGPNKMEGQGGRMISHAFGPGNSQVIWAGSASGGLWLSENGGDSWQPMTDQIPSTGVGAVAANPLNINALLIGTGEGYAIGTTIRPGLGVFKSIDRGLMWEQSDFDYQSVAGVSAFKIVWSPADTNNVWLAATKCLLLPPSHERPLPRLVRQRGGRFAHRPQCGLARRRHTLAQHRRRDYVGATRPPDLPNIAHIYKSDNFGDSWTPIQGGLPDLPVNAIAVHHFIPGVVFAATDLGVYITCDDGNTWAEYNDNLPVSIALDLQFNPADTTLLVGTLGRGAWRTKAWVSEVSATDEPARRSSLGFANIFPNPASEQVRIQYFLEKTANVRLEVVNVLGQKVAALFSGKQAAGKHEAVWSGMTVNGLRARAGVYFVRLSVGGEGVTRRVVRN